MECGNIADIEDLSLDENASQERRARLERRRKASQVRKKSSSEVIAAKQVVIPHRKDSIEVYWRLFVPVLVSALVLLLAFRLGGLITI